MAAIKQESTEREPLDETPLYHELMAHIGPGRPANTFTPKTRPATITTAEEEVEQSDVRPIRNYELVDVGEGTDKKTKKRALGLLDIGREVLDLSHGWPKRVGSMLFVDEGGDIRFLANVSDLFAYLGKLGPVQWATGLGVNSNQMTPKNEFEAHLKAEAENFEQVERLPHEPPIDGFYYAWRPPDDYEPTGQYFNRLLGFFDNYETDHDRDLIRAMFLTPFWGGLHGTRPAFAIMAKDRGHGKSTLKDTVKELCGGVEVEPGGRNEDHIITRLLSADGLLARTVCVDNIKGGTGSALLESLISQTIISGRRLYEGEANRPNTLTFVLTGNSPRLSRDMADRSFIIRLAKPKPKPNWRAEVFSYIRTHRERIIADAVYILRAEAIPNEASDRWQGWVDGVLTRSSGDPGGVVAQNQTRRDEYDEDLDEAENILAAVYTWQTENTGAIFINNDNMNRLVNNALNTHLKTNEVGGILNGHIESGRLPGVKRHRTNQARGYQIRK